MTARGQTFFFRLQVSDYGTPERLESSLDQIIDELDELGAIDADFAAALAMGQVTINFAVEAATVHDALADASAKLRSAIHAAEGRTPEWPSIDELTVESIDFDGDDGAAEGPELVAT